MAGEFQRSLGLELGGTRNDRTALAVLDFFPKTQRLILVDIDIALTGDTKISPDEALIGAVQELAKNAKSLSGMGVHSPTSLPPYFKLGIGEGKKLPHGDKSKNAEVVWMNRAQERIKPRPKAAFLPYLQRPCEIWMRYLTPEKFIMPDALGANFAPLAARYQFLAPHFGFAATEVLPRATLTRLVSALGLAKNIARLYTDVEQGVTFREDFLRALLRKLPQMFIYEKDLETMAVQMNCFNAFLAALTLRMSATGQTEAPPRGFPRHSTWIHIPKTNPDWNLVFGK
ncbi:MAG: hypothetical protein JST16_15735 [Bdellovibrionales bacterium]|nr:hypothetical protein [Bdellovibrionales bacterium]